MMNCTDATVSSPTAEQIDRGRSPHSEFLMTQDLSGENPYSARETQPQGSESSQPEPVGGDNMAGLGARFFAHMVDMLLYLAGPVASVAAGLSMSGKNKAEEANVIAMTIVLGGIALALVVIVINVVLLTVSGQSIGKRLLGIRIVRMDGSRASFGRIFFLRFFLVYVIMGSVAWGLVQLVDALLIFRDSRRTLHDEIADTHVVEV